MDWNGMKRLIVCYDKSTNEREGKPVVALPTVFLSVSVSRSLCLSRSLPPTATSTSTNINSSLLHSPPRDTPTNSLFSSCSFYVSHSRPSASSSPRETESIWLALIQQRLALVDWDRITNSHISTISTTDPPLLTHSQPSLPRPTPIQSTPIATP